MKALSDVIVTSSSAETILSQLREQVGAGTPRALKFAAGPLPESSGEGPAGRSEQAPASSPERRAEAAEIAAGIEDDELRRLVARAAAASLSSADRRPPDDRRF